MANHSATKKSVRKNARRVVINGARRTRVRTFLKKVEAAISAKDKKVAQEALRVAQSEMMTAVSRGVYKINTASRKISRLNAKVKAIG